MNTRPAVRRWSRRLPFFAAVVAFPAFIIAAPPKVRFDGRAVIAERITPGASTTWLAVVHEPQPYHVRVREYAKVVVDDDRDGIVRFELPATVAPESRWVVVDMASGEWASAEPGNGRTRMKPLSPPVIVRRGNGSAAALRQQNEYTKFWLIRPDHGAWVRTVEDGAGGDDDAAADGNTTARLEALTPVAGGPPPPDDFQRGDILIVVSPFDLKWFEMKVRD